eukprot:662450-Amphidinium_carterae.1
MACVAVVGEDWRVTGDQRVKKGRRRKWRPNVHKGKDGAIFHADGCSGLSEDRLRSVICHFLPLKAVIARVGSLERRNMWLGEH